MADKTVSQTERDAHDALTDEEILAIREIIEQQKRWKWLATGSRNVAFWIAGMIAGWVALQEFIINYIKRAMGS